MKKLIRRALDHAYAKRLRRQIPSDRLPRHVGILIDGNRRWAKSAGFLDVSDGHRAGGAKVQTFLTWCDEIGIQYATIFMLSDDNLHRDQNEVATLLSVVEGVVTDLAAPGNHWELTLIGALDVLPASTAAVLKEAAAATQGRRGGVQVNIAVGYGGQREIVDAMRSAVSDLRSSGMGIDEIIDSLNPELISRHTYTAEQPNLDLIIRTSGEQRLSGFMLWQSAYAEMYFCEGYWPAFRKIDYLRALRSYARRERRFGR
jgi:short-chain Z-isoprenyl diphosphate synthase